MKNPLLLLRFASVADHRSFSDAARALGLDQPTLSRQIRQLERELGLTLFRRTTRKVELTAEGAAILPSVRDLALSMDGVLRQIHIVASEKDARLRFGMHPFVYWSPAVHAILAAYAARRRDVRVETLSGTSTHLLGRLRGKTLDTALILKPDRPEYYQIISVMQVEPHIVLPDEHPAARLPALDADDLAGLKTAIFRPGRDRQDFERVYGPFFEQGAEPVYVSEGAAAVVFHATTDRLAMISLRSTETPPPSGFVRKRVTDAPSVEFVLARLSGDHGATLNQFWTCAERLAA